MFARAMKLSPILLLTLNIWSSMTCCCLGQKAPVCSEPISQIDMAHDQGQSSDHHAPASKSCQGNSDSGEGPILSSPCGCDTHQMAQADVFLLPTVEENSLSAPEILFALAWTESILPNVKASYLSSSNAFLVSDRWAPSLSMLARFLI